MTVCYLEVDDEITGAIARIRAVKDGEAIIIVPPGSRIATSRINFKLLVREGNERHLNLVAVSDEPSARALAISAGLPAYDSLAVAEQALAIFRDQDRRLAERLGRQPSDGPGGKSIDAAPPPSTRRTADAEATQILAAPVAAPLAEGRLREMGTPRTLGRGASSPEAARTRPIEREEPAARRRGVGATPIIGAAVLLLLLAGVGYGAYVLLPTATITLQPQTTLVTPAAFTVVADPAAAVVDVDAGVIPAERLEIPLNVSNGFFSTGLQVQETRSIGAVRFRSENTINEVPILEGTVVATSDGVDFETTQAAVVPRADFTTSTPGTVDVPVRATRGGPVGNVPADSITELARGLRDQLVSVRNPDATTGGRRVEEQVIQQADYDAAVAQLDSQLELALADAMRDPQTTPRGLTLYPVSAQTGDAQTSPSSLELVGTAAATFELTMTSTASVTAVNETFLSDLAADRLRSTLATGQHAVGDRVDVTIGEGTVVVESVTYEVTPSASVYTEPDRVAITAAVRGKSIPDARQILAPYGMVEISIWPEFVDRLPDQTARISLVVVTPSPRP